MANIPSAEKKNRQRLKRRARNLSHLSNMRTSVKKVRAALEGGADAAKTALADALRRIDKAAQKGAIKKATASRTKSRLSKAVARAK